MTIEVLSKKINDLNKIELNTVFNGEVLNTDEYLKIIARAKAIYELRDLFFQRATLYIKNKEFDKAALDYFDSARLGHPASKMKFAEFTSIDIQKLTKNVNIQDGLTADTAFIAFLQHSAGVGKEMNHSDALYHLKCAAQLGHFYANELCKTETVEMITQSMLISKKNAILVSLTLDNANSMLGTYYFRTQHLKKAFDHFELSMKLGSGHGFMGSATMYFEGISTAKNYQKSFRLYAIAAEMGAVCSLRDDAYNALMNIAKISPQDIIPLLNDLAESRLVAFPDFREGLSNMLQKKLFRFWPDKLELSDEIKSKIHEILALCEITQNPCAPESGINHMRKITDFSVCSPSICQKLVIFHGNFPGRITMSSELQQLIAPFEQIAKGETPIHVSHQNNKISSMSSLH